MPIVTNSSENTEDYILDVIGDLGENVEFPRDRIRLSQRIIFNCDKVKHVSSYAAQKWTVWMKSQDRRQQFVFRFVQPRIIALFNLIEGYLPLGTTIESFYVPYECENCDYEELFLARRGREYIEATDGKPAKILLAQEINCTKCKNGMKLGVWENQYLKFLNINNNESQSE